MSSPASSSAQAAPGVLRVLRGLMPLLRPHAGSLGVALMLLLLATALQLAGPLLVRHVIDVDIPQHDTRGLVTSALLFLGTLAGYLVLNALMRIRVETVGQKVILDLRTRLFQHLVGQSLSFHDKHAPGALIARVQGDTDALRQIFAGATVTFAAAGALLCGMLVVLLTIEPRLALLAVGLTIVVTGLALALLKGGIGWERELRHRAATLTADVAEKVNGVQAIQAFARESEAVAELDALGKSKCEAQWRAWSFQMMPHQVQSVLDIFATSAALGFGALWVLNGTTTLGTLVMALDYLRRLHEPLAHAAEQVGTVQRAVASGARVLGLLAEPHSVKDPESPARWDELRQGIELRDVSFSYRGDDEQALRDVSFVVPRGETWAIVGATGSGKSTLFHMLLRFHDPQAGIVFVDGIDVRTLRQADLRSRMALVLQDVHVFAGDVLHNLSPSGTVADAASAERLREAGRAAGLESVVARLPGGWNAPVAERGGNLSAGERQLLSLARALARDPDILLLDEATSSVDPRTEAAIQASLSRLLAGRTALVIAHRLATVRHAHGILVMEDGRIIERGTHDELLRADGHYARLYSVQLATSDAEEGAA